MTSFRSSFRSATLGLLAMTLLVCVVLASPIVADARALEIESFSAGLSNYAAGGHPDASTSFRFATEPRPETDCMLGAAAPGGVCHVVKGGAPKDVVVDLPKGLVGNPRGVRQCANSELMGFGCPQDSQVGVAHLELLYAGLPGLVDRFAVFNMEPARGEVARLGMKVIALATNISVTVRTDGEYRIRGASRNIFTGLPLIGATITLWGDPDNPANDPNRVCPGSTTIAGCNITTGGIKQPFMTAPAECGVDGVAELSVSTYQSPSHFETATSAPQQVTGCDALPFHPRISARPTTASPDAPTGLDVELTLPQRFDNAQGVEAPPLKDAVVTLPEGMSVNPASADGLEACPDDRLNLASDAPMTCPLASKIGSVEAESPVLEEKLTGGVYLRPQASDDPESGDLFRLAIVLENEERGISVRLPGRTFVDSESGRIRAVFADNPQLPVSRIELSLKSGPRAPLATPAECGTETTTAELSAWSGQQVGLTDTFAISCTDGLGGFSPSFAAGTLDSVAGGHSPFGVTISKPDGQSPLDGVSLRLPAGLLANLRGSVGQRVGSVTAFAGPGSQPFPFPGRVYLEGRYGDAPFSLRVVVPAKAGPFDLGEVVVRQRIYVDPETAEVSVVSDPVPTVVKGVPVRLQRLDVDVDRPGFVVNPTSCEPMVVGGELRAATGQTAAVSTRFRASDCGELGFSPKLSMRLSGKRQTKTGGHPALSAVLTQPKGQANTGLARVTLPPSIALDAVNSYDPKLVCDYDASLKADCPTSSVIGRATAHTPVLNRPLTGQVHLVQGIKFGPTGNRIRTTPSLLVKLRGEVAVNLRARSNVRGGRLVTTFPQVPDAPVSRFEMTINGGGKGILVVTRTRRSKINLCAGRQVADVETDGQNGKRADYRTTVKTPCTAKARRAARKALRAKR